MTPEEYAAFLIFIDASYKQTMRFYEEAPIGTYESRSFFYSAEGTKEAGEAVSKAHLELPKNCSRKDALKAYRQALNDLSNENQRLMDSLPNDGPDADYENVNAICTGHFTVSHYHLWFNVR